MNNENNNLGNQIPNNEQQLNNSSIVQPNPVVSGQMIQESTIASVQNANTVQQNSEQPSSVSGMNQQIENQQINQGPMVIPQTVTNEQVVNNTSTINQPVNNNMNNFDTANNNSNIVTSNPTVSPNQGYQINNQVSPNQVYPTNNQVASPNQGYPINNQAVSPNQGYPTNNQVVSPNQGYPTNNQAVFPNQGYPINNQVVSPNQGYPTNKKSNKSLFIIIGLLVVVIIVLAAGLLRPKDGADDRKNINDYEENSYNDNNSGNNSISSDSNVQEYNGFEFKKIDGYDYFIEDGMLYVKNNEKIFMINVINSNMNEVEKSKQIIREKIENQGLMVKSLVMDNYLGTPILSAEVTNANTNKTMFYYIIQSPSDSYVFEFYYFNSNNNYGHDSVGTIVDIVNNTKISTGISNYSTTFGTKINLY